MHINPNWRILTIGDGDLSFSLSLLRNHSPKKLTATVLDRQQVLTEKYGDDHYQQLSQLRCEVLFEFDVTQPASWQGRLSQSYDLVIFQFPLIPGFTSGDEFLKQCADLSVNTLNRALLRHYLIHSLHFFLDPQGPQLAFITSKDVKPYRAWNIEHALHPGTGMDYLGSMPFQIEQFPGYRVRHVDADRHVKETQGITYVWSPKPNAELSTRLTPATHAEAHCCAMCRVGPLMTAKDRQLHQESKRHQTMLHYEQQWQRYLQRIQSDSV